MSEKRKREEDEKDLSVTSGDDVGHAGNGDSSKKKDKEERLKDVIEEEEEDGDDEEIGPMPVAVKKKRSIAYESVYISNLPSCESYEKSYMHREVITHLLISKSDFIITSSADGHIKFWKKTSIGIEFVKHFRAHLGNIQDICVNSTGSLLASISNDKSLKVFDVINFDMINMMKLEYIPGRCEWIHSSGDPIQALAVSDADSAMIYTYDSTGSNTPLQVLDRIHSNPVVCMKYNSIYSTMVSVDNTGMLDFWMSHRHDYKFPSSVVHFDSKLDTDLYEFAKNKCVPHDIAFSLDGLMFAAICNDRKVRVFKFMTGKLLRVFDESLQQLQSLQQMQPQLSNMEFGKRMSMEKDLEKSEAFRFQKVVFDESGYFIAYPTMLGIKIVNWYTNKCVKLIGKAENLRALSIGLHQTVLNKPKSSVTAEMEASDNPGLETAAPDPTLFVTAYKKNRFYMFSKRTAQEISVEGMPLERDVFNEKPSREDMLSATAAAPVVQKVWENCIIHTTLGDIHCKLFINETPKTCENFCVHSKNGYYNGHIFHRVIRQFMIQTGDPTGTGTGGESIWGGEFEDEIRPDLKHDKPYTLSMANAGKNTNGSQFFITVVPSPWLDNKHTVFGRVVKGMEIAQNISNVKTHPKTDKPYDDVKIVNISLKS